MPSACSRDVHPFSAICCLSVSALCAPPPCSLRTYDKHLNSLPLPNSINFLSTPFFFCLMASSIPIPLTGPWHSEGLHEPDRSRHRCDQCANPTPPYAVVFHVVRRFVCLSLPISHAHGRRCRWLRFCCLRFGWRAEPRRATGAGVLGLRLAGHPPHAAHVLPH